jgi:hypothetical protein
MIMEIITSTVVEYSKKMIKSAKIYKYNSSPSFMRSQDSVEEFTDYVESASESSWRSTLGGSELGTEPPSHTLDAV